MKTTVTTAPISGGLERDQLKSAKIAVLKLINEDKEILFGKLSDTLTREVKEGKWAEVAEHAHELGAFPWHRSWDYLKDTTWQNWRKRFLEKRGKKDKFEKMGLTTKILYDEADLLIMEILDSVWRQNGSIPPSASLNNSSSYSMASATSDAQIRDISDMLEIEFDVKHEDEGELEDDFDVVDGHVPGNNRLQSNGGEEGEDVVEEGAGMAALMEFQQDYEDSGNGFQNHNNGHGDEEDLDLGLGGRGTGNSTTTTQPKIISTSSLASPTSRAASLRKTAFACLRSGGVNGRKRPASSMATTTSNYGFGNIPSSSSREKELADLKCRKIRAELELLNKESYKKDLEILQLERSLGLPASHITRKFYKHSSSGSGGIANNSSNHSNNSSRQN